ncbi:MAG TPA: hypothetical protein VH277_01320 [Gemmatimonadaceae bacterium]|jgi:hypothetical protein|nr:hypothetical protein [Gemmatimonadaceae bacterium]
MTTHVRGSATAYRLYDVGYGIELDRAGALVGEATRGRSRPARSEAQTFQIRPPLSVSLGERVITIGGESWSAVLSAHLFDFGVCSMRLTVPSARTDSWDAFARFGTDFDMAPGVAPLLDGELTALLARIAPAVERADIQAVVEDYVVYRVESLTDDRGALVAHSSLADEDLVPLLLRETRPLSLLARRELLANRFSFYANDLAVLTWDNALVIEPRPEDEDIEFVLEFANAQLLELRVYDAQLDAQLPALYDRIAARRQRLRYFTRAYRPLMADLQTRVAEVTEIVERAENAFKVTDDVYLARVYAAALDIFRERAWRSGIDRKLQIFRDTYTMLNAEAQVSRAELMEIIVVLLIAAELIFGFLR